MSSISPPALLNCARKPRVNAHPAFTVSLASPVIDLSARAGQLLDPWQQDGLTVMLAVRPTGMWTCFEYGEIVGRQNGKNAMLEARALGGMFLLDEELIMWSAHEYKTAMESFRRVQTLLGRLGSRINDNLYDVDGSLVKVINTNGEESLERLDTGQRLKFIARSKGSGRGFSGDVNIIDECFAYTRAQQEALMPTMAARPNPQIIYTSSPPLTTTTGEVMFSLRARAEAGEDPALGWRDWGLAGDLDNLKGIDLDDRALWEQTNPAWGYRITEEFVARERASMSPAGFARERLGIWPRAPIDGGWQVISQQRWSDRLDPDSHIHGTVALAVDVTPNRSHAAISAGGRRDDADRHVELVEHREGTGWVVRRVKSICMRQDVCVVVVDGAGPAGSLIPDLERELEPLGVKVHKLGAQEAAAAFGAFHDGFVPPDERDPDVDEEDDDVEVDPTAIWHLDQAPLSIALAGAAKRPLAGGSAWDRINTEIDITSLVSASNALYGHARYGHLEGAQPWVDFG